MAGDPESPMVTTPMGQGALWCPIYPLIGANLSWFYYTQCRLVQPPTCLTHFIQVIIIYSLSVA